MYVCMYMYVCIYIYIYIVIHTYEGGLGFGRLGHCRIAP